MIVPNRVVAETDEGLRYQWRYFDDRVSLLGFSESRIPRNERDLPATLSAQLRCSLGLTPVEQSAQFLDLEEAVG